jgi:hypothetical protein
MQDYRFRKSLLFFQLQQQIFFVKMVKGLTCKIPDAVSFQKDCLTSAMIRTGLLIASPSGSFLQHSYNVCDEASPPSLVYQSFSSGFSLDMTEYVPLFVLFEQSILHQNVLQPRALSSFIPNTQLRYSQVFKVTKVLLHSFSTKRMKVQGR